MNMRSYLLYSTCWTHQGVDRSFSCLLFLRSWIIHCLFFGVFRSLAHSHTLSFSTPMFLMRVVESFSRTFFFEYTVPFSLWWDVIIIIIIKRWYRILCAHILMPKCWCVYALVCICMHVCCYSVRWWVQSQELTDTIDQYFGIFNDYLFSCETDNEPECNGNDRTFLALYDMHPL